MFLKQLLQQIMHFERADAQALYEDIRAAQKRGTKLDCEETKLFNELFDEIMRYDLANYVAGCWTN